MALPCTMTLNVTAVATPLQTWAGVAKGGVGNSKVRFEAPADGTYHIALDTPTGFAHILVDSAPTVLAAPRLVQSHSGGFDVPLTAGVHQLTIVQRATDVTTTWRLQIDSVTPVPAFAHFTGNVDANDQVDLQVPLLGLDDRPINFRLATLTGSGTLTVTNGAGQIVFTGRSVDGETVWGTTVLKPGQNKFTLRAEGGTALTYDLTLYTLETAPYSWSGRSQTTGTWDSRIQLNFAASALYTFTYGAPGGRYQFDVDDQYIQKTAETTGTVSYYLAAGVHTLTIVPDRSAATTWTLDISAADAAHDSLPYAKQGGQSA